jgi:hypothetical protein
MKKRKRRRMRRKSRTVEDTYEYFESKYGAAIKNAY